MRPLQAALAIVFFLLVLTTWPAWGNGDAQLLETTGILLAYGGLVAAVVLGILAKTRRSAWPASLLVLGAGGMVMALLMQPLEGQDVDAWAATACLVAGLLLVGFVAEQSGRAA